jgi:hypothetical protein
MSNLIKIPIWFICFVLVLNFALDMVNESSTVANIIGILVAVFAVYVSVKTECFTNINLKKNKTNEKDH